MFKYFFVDVNKSRIVDFGHSKPVESHDQVYGGWTEIEPTGSKDDSLNNTSRVNLLEELNESDDEEEQANPVITPKKRLIEILLYLRYSVETYPYRANLYLL